MSPFVIEEPIPIGINTSLKNYRPLLGVTTVTIFITNRSSWSRVRRNSKNEIVEETKITIVDANVKLN